MYSEFNKAVGKFFRRKRENYKMTLAEVGEAVGHTKSWYYDIERGKNNIYFNDAKKLCTLFDCDVSDLAKATQDYIDE